jgi:hypothetical protein
MHVTRVSGSARAMLGGRLAARGQAVRAEGHPASIPRPVPSTRVSTRPGTGRDQPFGSTDSTRVRERTFRDTAVARFKSSRPDSVRSAGQSGSVSDWP